MSSAVRVAGAPANVPKSLVTAIFGPEAPHFDPLAVRQAPPDRSPEALDVPVRYAERFPVSHLFRRPQRAAMESH